jgi:myo-inositol catabolism protein IolS
MRYRKLGKTDMEVSVIALGCWGLAGGKGWGVRDEKESLATIKAALEAGVNFFDTAECYNNGYSEELLGKALAGSREKALIATKVVERHLEKESVIKACEDSLKRLNTDYIDYYQIHWPNANVSLEETLGALEILKKQGKIRAAGVCNFGEIDLEEILQKSSIAIEANQVAYSLLWRAIEFSVQPKCLKNGLGILAYSPLAQGLLSGKYLAPDEFPETRARTKHFSKDRPYAQHGEGGCEIETFMTIRAIKAVSARLGISMIDLALAWLLHQDGVTSVLVGAVQPEQIRENAKAVSVQLTAAVIAELNQKTESLKRKLGVNPDQWANRMR